MKTAMERERRWQLFAPLLLTAAGLAIGVAAAPAAVVPVTAMAVLAAAAGIAPGRATQLARRLQPAYALLVAARARGQ